MMLRKWCRVASLLAGLVLPPGLAGGASTPPVIIKMATPVPERSSWFQILKEMAEAAGRPRMAAAEVSRAFAARSPRARAAARRS